MKDNTASHGGEPAGAPARCETDPPQRILVVDDDIGMRQLSTEVLISCGYQVDAAADGAAAWQALNNDSYDLLITDNNMPNVSGVELLRKLHAARMTLPVILVSGKVPTEELNRYPWLHIEATLLKPFTIPELLGTVQEVLRVADGAHQQLEPLPVWQIEPSADRISV